MWTSAFKSARPLFISLGLILEEGLDKEILEASIVIKRPVIKTARVLFLIYNMRITRIGKEVGLPLAAFAEAYRNKPFSENLVLVSGVNENLGKGVDEVDGVDLYMRAVRESMYKELTTYFHLKNDIAQRLAEGIVRSDLTYERELVSYQPTDEEVLAGFPLAAG